MRAKKGTLYKVVVGFNQQGQESSPGKGTVRIYSHLKAGGAIAATRTEGELGHRTWASWRTAATANVWPGGEGVEATMPGPLLSSFCLSKVSPIGQTQPETKGRGIPLGAVHERPASWATDPGAEAEGRSGGTDGQRSRGEDSPGAT